MLSLAEDAASDRDAGLQQMQNAIKHSGKTLHRRDYPGTFGHQRIGKRRRAGRAGRA